MFDDWSMGVIDLKIQPKDYIAGGVSACPPEELMPSGDWLHYAPTHEMQSRDNVDLAMCTNFAATDCIEAYISKKWGLQTNWNERALAVMSGQKKYGNSISTVAEAIRTKGLVPQELHEWKPKEHNTYDKMITATKEELKDWYEAGQEFLLNYDVKWEWVYEPVMKEALKSSPLFVASLYASEGNKENGIYQTHAPQSELTTHATALMKIEDDGTKWVDDSYATQLKHLSSDFRIPIGIRFHIEKPNENNMYYPPHNSLVIVADTGERLMYVGGDDIYADDSGKILLEVQARNAKDGLSRSFPIVHVTKKVIEHLRRIRLNGSPL